jgi:hypothetical protein
VSEADYQRTSTGNIWDYDSAGATGQSLIRQRFSEKSSPPGQKENSAQDEPSCAEERRADLFSTL